MLNDTTHDARLDAPAPANLKAVAWLTMVAFSCATWATLYSISTYVLR